MWSCIRMVAMAGVLGLAAVLAQSQPGSAVGVPPGIDVQGFQAVSAGASCADQTNRLFAIDGQMVFWSLQGCRGYGGYSYSLFGAASKGLLCQSNGRSAPAGGTATPTATVTPSGM